MKKILALLSTLPLLACSNAAPEEEATGIVQLSKQELMIGETLEFYGYGLEEEDEILVLFEGEFRADDGQAIPVSKALRPIRDGQVQLSGDERTLSVLRLSRFGPFTNPLAPTLRPGTFYGTVTAVVEGADGLVTRHAPHELTLKVAPSIIIERFEPFDADCGAPALRALPGMPYILEVRPVGIAATRFVYEIAAVNGVGGVAQFEHTYDNAVPTDTLGAPGSQEGAIVFNPIPQDKQFYVAGLRVMAYDDQNRMVETALPIPVHAPIEVVYSGGLELAELYDPVPVSGCIPGSIGTRVSYSESTSESRQQQVSVRVSQSYSQSVGLRTDARWQEGISEGSSESTSLGIREREEESSSENYGVSYNESESNNTRISSSDGESWTASTREGESVSDYQERTGEVYGSVNASVTVGASAEGSVPGFAKVSGKVSTTVGVTAGGSTGGREGERRSNSSEQGFSMGGAHSESQSFGSTTTEGYQESSGGNFALSSAHERSETDTESRNTSHVWNVSQGEALSQNDGESFSQAEQQTWASTVSNEVGVGLSGNIPKGRSGMFFRQTTRYVQRAEVRGYNLCGLARHIGELQFNRWEWAPELALGGDCETSPPQPKLPPATCFVEPCSGG
ncbi:hypothetical protein KKB55_08995 [Myxococcota bacterium]|nr:hypothetical protein [Myxococcota bacterium]